MEDFTGNEAQTPYLPAYSRQLLAGVWQAAGDELQVRVHHLDTWSERAVAMLVGVKDFRVRFAEAVVHRASEGLATGRREAPEVHGVAAYPGAGPEFRRALAGWPEAEQWLELFLEGIKAVLQAEFCVAQERGFSSEEEYERYFADKFAGSCLYYNRPLAEVQPWGMYVADQVRAGCLFLRLRTATLQVAERFLLSAVMTDSFHELSLALEVEPAGSVRRAEATSIRVPDRVCRLAAEGVRKLVGLRLVDLGRSDLARLLAGPEGCTHLADLAADAVFLARSVEARARAGDAQSGHGGGAA